MLVFQIIKFFCVVSIINRSDFAMKLLVEFLVGTSMEIGRNS